MMEIANNTKENGEVISRARNCLLENAELRIHRSVTHLKIEVFQCFLDVEFKGSVCSEEGTDIDFSRMFCKTGGTALKQQLFSYLSLLECDAVYSGTH